MMFFKERGISMPRQVTRQVCFDYMDWRQKPNKSKGKYRACQNTALNEIRFLARIMNEAVLRGFAPKNECVKLGVKRTKATAPWDTSDKSSNRVVCYIFVILARIYGSIFV